jgi:hypothetical protein
MITFETQEDFENAVIQVVIDRLGINVRCGGDHFVSRVMVALTNKVGDRLIEGEDATC